jgi:hypothetical protein
MKTLEECRKYLADEWLKYDCNADMIEFATEICDAWAADREALKNRCNECEKFEPCKNCIHTKTHPFTEADMERVRSELQIAIDLLETAWGIICNAGEGDWTKEHPEWQEAAKQLREKYFDYLSTITKKEMAELKGEKHG